MRHEFEILNPWREWHRISRRLGHFAHAPSPTPLAVWVGEEGGKLRMPLPGIKPEQLDISVLGEEVTVRGRRDADANADAGSTQATVLRQERQHGEFSRRITLPFRVDAQQVKASYTDGVLTVTLPRLAEDKPQRIAVQAA